MDPTAIPGVSSGDRIFAYRGIRKIANQNTTAVLISGISGYRIICYHAYVAVTAKNSTAPACGISGYRIVGYSGKSINKSAYSAANKFSGIPGYRIVG